jgi:hypothetical protein
MKPELATKVRAKYLAPIDEAELAVRMCEASYQLKRPPGLTAVGALKAMEDDSRDGWRRAARAAMEYWRECIEGREAEMSEQHHG